MNTLLGSIGGKAINLMRLKEIPGINIPQFTVLPTGFSKSECEKAIALFLRDFASSTVAVRSSATKEDLDGASFAGMYLTRLRVPANISEVMAAVKEVRLSKDLKEKTVIHYMRERRLGASNHGVAVIIQEMVSPDISGVIFSHSLNAHDGYYVISATNGLGEAVASGLVNGELIRVARAIEFGGIQDDWVAKLISATRAIENYFKNDSLDIEFAFRDDTLYILQCRPIATSPRTLIKQEDESRLVNQLNSICADISAHFNGDVLGDMIDINPLELLGSNPSRLDISIFKCLFGDTAVEQVRRDMGYDPLDIGLIRIVGRKPYVSLRASAFSFRPKGISIRIYDRMYDVYRKMIMDNPGLQSRVEFAVYAMSCGKKLERIMSNGQLNAEEKNIVRSAFQRLNSAFIVTSDACSSDFKRQAVEYQKGIQSLKGSTLANILSYASLGAKSFVRVARLAFYWKNKFEETYPDEELNELIIGHIQSVSSRLKNDLQMYLDNKLTRDDVINRYGHLRPGQFGIFGEAYADDPDHYLFSQISTAHNYGIAKRQHPYEGSIEFRNAVIFMQAREEMKFLFSQAFNIFIEELKAALKYHKIAREEAARLSWDELRALLSHKTPTVQNEKNVLPMILPEVLIPCISNLKIIRFSEAMPSYITHTVVKARICALDTPNQYADVRDALVLIPNADPGYDFLFHSGIAGIITKTGGPASHMCIRAVELQIPACIGCGDRIYDKLSRAHIAILDCSSKQIIVSE